MNLKQRRELRFKYTQYHMINGILFQNNYGKFLLICLEKNYAQKVISDLHDGPMGGNYGGETIAHKFLQVGYYWPTLFKYAHPFE